ncbi:CPBP family intramembrane glutamic endopeptidase [Paenibacillus wynnii]|uniref:CPBP family intramembrane glutamic endopeptidase n=1 Tax=Paenibacillus wynnii TaxID=268407 RepID=UPI002793B87B|nr:type II CAAX endopeptidase family protein [Paenibacillus wynnii]MDQ0194652.1 membrane protease YdiL (CAAX protease family) [Paenibacillus wynnii]
MQVSFRSKPQQNRTQNRRIFLFLAVTFGFTWLCWLPLLINKQFTAGVPLLPGQFYLGSFGPLLGALVSVQIRGGTGFRAWCKTAFSFAFPKKWLAIAAGLPLIYGAVAILAHTLITGSLPDVHTFGLTSDLPPQFNIWMTSLVWMLTFGIGEESGWRGFLLPELHKRYSLFTSALLVAVIWMAWHLPAFWFNESYLGMGFGVLGWAISLTYGSVVLAWICAGSRWSIIPVIVWHGIFDLLTASDQGAEVMAMVCSMLVIVHGILLMRKLGRSGRSPS